MQAHASSEGEAVTERSDQIFDRGLDVFGDVVGRLEPSDWDRPSPCEGWTALDVLGHLGSAIDFGVAIMRGEQHTWPEAPRPADLVDGDPVGYWRGITERARAALEGADLDMVRETPVGPRTVAEGLAFPAIDLFVHAWDIGRSAGIDVEIPADTIEFAHAYIDPLPVELVRGPRGAFGPEVTVPTDASPTEVFIAWTGRHPRATG